MTQTPQSILNRLKELRRMILLWQGTVGLGRCLVVLVLMLIFSFAIDRTFRMDHSQRLIMLILMLLFLLWNLYKYFLKPLLQNTNDDALIERVEKANPKLKSSIISALQFSREKNKNGGVSGSLIESAISQGAQYASELNFRGVLDWQRFKKMALCGIISIIIPIVFATLSPENAQTWFNRNLMLDSSQWPRYTQFEIDGVKNNIIKVPVEADLDIIAHAKGIMPELVYLKSEQASGQTHTEQMPQRLDGSFRISYKKVTEEFKFQVSGGDGLSQWVNVVLLQRPEILSFTATAIPPEYIGQDRILLGKNSNQLECLEGSQLIIEGESDLALKKVTLLRDSEIILEQEIKGHKQFKLQLSPQNISSAHYQISLISMEDAPSIRDTLIQLKIITDQKPHVVAKLKGLSQLITRDAMIATDCEMKDDYGIVNSTMKVQGQGPEGEPLQFAEQLHLGTKTFSKEAKLETSFDCRDKKLKIGSTLSLHIEASDANNLNGPGLGKSNHFSFQVVSHEDMHKDLEQREQVLRAKLESFVGSQRKLRDEARLFSAAGEELKLDKVKQRQLLADKKQRRLARDFSSITTALGQITTEIINNRLEDETGKIYQRLSRKVHTPLLELDQKVLPAIANLLSASRSLDPSRQATAWSQVKNVQQVLLSKVEAILDNMIEKEDVRKIQTMLDQLMSLQEKINQDTQKKAESEISSIFEE